MLLNVSSKSLVHTFKGWGSPVRCLAGSPALDTVGVGCADGTIHIHNLKYASAVLFCTSKPACCAMQDATAGGRELHVPILHSSVVFFKVVYCDILDRTVLQHTVL